MTLSPYLDRSPRTSLIQARLTGTVLGEEQGTARNGYVLHEHDELRLVPELVVQQHRRQETECRPQQRCDARLKADDDRQPGTDLKNNGRQL